MPIYEYECEKCGGVVEVMQRMGDPGPASCRDAQSEGTGGCTGKLRRKMSASSVRSGSGQRSAALDVAACGRCGVPGGPCVMNDG